jgi:hypothetical protein
VLRDGRFLGRESVGSVGEVWEGGDAMAGRICVRIWRGVD